MAVQSVDEKTKIGSFFIPSIAEVFFVLIFLILSILPNSKLLNDGDTAYHIRVGQHILETRDIPEQDIFSLHEPKPVFTAHEWLSEVIMAVVHQYHGITGIVVFYAFLISLSVYILFKLLQKYSSNIIFVSLIMALTVASNQLHWLARPHIFSLLLTVIWFGILERHRHADTKLLWVLPLIMMFWVNLHGGFLTGFILNMVYLIGNFLEYKVFSSPPREIHRKRAFEILIVTIICLFSSLVNPYGVAILLFPFKLMGQKIMVDHISEFLSPNFHSVIFISFELTILLFLSLLFLSKKRLEVIDLGLLLVFLHLSLYSRRYIPLFGIVAAPVLVKHSAVLRYFTENRVYRFIDKKAASFSETDRLSKGFFWAALTTIIIVSMVAQGNICQAFDREKKPVDAIDFIHRENIPGNMFNSQEFGDFLVMYAFPKYRVFIDGRVDMYGTELFEEYTDIVSFKPGWEELLEKYNITWIFYPSDSEFSRFLSINPDWEQIYSDTVTSIFLKNVPENRAMIDKYANKFETRGGNLSADETEAH